MKKPPGPPHGGCTFAEDPVRNALSARLLWTRAYDPAVLIARGRGAAPGETALDFGNSGIDLLVCGSGPARHIAIQSGLRRLRIDLSGTWSGEGPVRLAVGLGTQEQLTQTQHLLHRLAFCLRHGRFPNEVRAETVRIVRSVHMLRAHDARLAGASLRDIGRVIFGSTFDPSGWRPGNDYQKSRIRRLVEEGAAMARGGWRAMLSA